MGLKMKALLCVLCFLVIGSEYQVIRIEATSSRRETNQVPDAVNLKDERNEESERLTNAETHEELRLARGAIVEDMMNTEEEVSPLPNIVVLLVDDLGYGDLSYSGHPTSRTPQIDQLASQSRFFTHHYVSSPVCSPSRASLLTGRLQMRSGVYPWLFLPENTLGMSRNETTLAALLKAKGYRTMATGKWHLGVGRNGEYLPTHFGFDHYLGLPYPQNMCPCITCFPEPQPECIASTCDEEYVSCPLYRNTTIVEQPVYLPSLTRRLVNEAVTFIDDAAAAETPFFLYFPFLHVHYPQFASEEFAWTSDRWIFGDALEELDAAVGDVVEALQRNNLLSSTLIWFSSDNGPSLARHERGGCAGLLRCGKGTTWEGGMRVPMFTYWPTKITPGRSNGLVSALDLLPTVASLVGLNTSDLILDGTDISPLLWDPLAPSPRQHMPFYPVDPDPAVGPLAVTNGMFKAHFYTMGSGLSDDSNYDLMCRSSHLLTRHDPPLLFNLYRDPGERYDLSADNQYSDVIQALTAWRNDHMANMTWNDPLTLPLDPSAQPCCTNPSCTPFPQCCDCPPSTPASAPFCTNVAP